MSAVVYVVRVSSDQIDSVWEDAGRAENRANEIINSTEFNAAVSVYVLNFAKGER